MRMYNPQVEKNIPDSAKIVEIFTLYGKDLFSYIHSIVKSREIAEDIFQESFLRLISYTQQTPLYEANLRGLIFKIAKNLSINHFKRDRRIHFIPIEEAGKGNSILKTELDEDRMDLFKLFQELLSDIKESSRDIFLMKTVSGMSTVQIASKLGLSERTVRRRLSTARAYLKSHYSMRDLEEIGR